MHDLELVAAMPDGRRVLRSRLEPMRGLGVVHGDDTSANVWFSVPAVRDRDTSAEKALIEFMYGWSAETPE